MEPITAEQAREMRNDALKKKKEERLKAEMELLAECLVEKKSLMKYEMIQKHIPWAEQCLQKYDDINETNVMLILKEEIGQVFVKVLEDAGVYKCTKEGREAFDRFLSTL